MISISETRDHLLISQLNEEVQNLHAAMHPDLFKPYNREEAIKAYRDFLSDPLCRCYIAEKNGKTIGYGVFFIREVKENAFHYTIKSLYIDQLAVLSEHRRSGAGKLLMQQAEKLATELSITRLELDHWSANTVAASFFRKQGYELRKERLIRVLKP
jgi:ribosomal protein S18 acetylase RimI-like enzyme